MRILFDQGTPAPLRRSLLLHDVSTVLERGWSTLSNGELLAEAERQFELLITTDKNVRHQQNLTGRRLALLVLPTTSWPRIQAHVADVERAVASIKPGEYRELTWMDRVRSPHHGHRDTE